MKRLLFICFIAIHHLLLAQNPPFILVGEEEFANTDIYSLLYDDPTDVLYVATNNGLYFYKQNKFSKLKGPDDQIGNSFFDLKKDNNGVIYCSNLKGQVFRIKNDSYEVFYQVPINQVSRYFYYFFDQSNRLIVSDRIDIHVIENNQSKLLYSGDIEESIYTANQGINKEIFWDLGKSKYAYYNNGEFQVKHFPDTLQKARYFYLKNNLVGSDLGGIFVSERGVVTSEAPIQFNSNNVQIDDSTIFSIGNKNGLLIIQLINNKLVPIDSVFMNEFISTIAINSNGTLFLGSFRGGIKIVKDYSIKEQNIGNKLLLDIAVDQRNDVYLSTRSGDVILYQDNQLRTIAKEDLNIDNIYAQSDFIFDQGPLKNVVYSNKQKSYSKESYESTYANKEQVYSNLKDLSVLDDSAYFVFRDKNILLVSKRKYDFPEYNISLENKQLRVYLVCTSYRPVSIHWHQQLRKLYYSDNFGTFCTTLENTSEKDSLLFQEKSFVANDIDEFEDLTLIASEKHGVLFFKNKEVVKVINERMGLKDNTIRKIRRVNELLFILTSDGLQVYDLNKNQFCPLGFNEGVVDKGISGFDVNQETLWIMYKSKIFPVSIEEIQRHDEVDLLWVDSIKINGNKVPYLKQGNFSYDENRLEIYFDYRNIETKNEVDILYTLEGFYNEWKVKPAAENQIQFESLPPGEYLFKIKARYGVDESELFAYKFNISAPIWFRWWFYVVLVCSVSLVLYFYFKYLLKRQKKRAQIEQELNASKLTAIRSQMNPHFIFNSLNSIQALVLKGDVEQSYNYINKFSNLVRNTLTFSDKEFIEIDLEIELLNTYLSLEKLRFRENFEYSIERNGIEDIRIPPLLIQPFIENAIVHGLLHKEGLKQLEITFELSETLVCTITDNGVGRSKSQEINQRQRPGHQSFAVSAVQRKLNLLKQRFTDKIGFRYYDLMDGDEAIGTSVVIHLPYVSD